MMMTDPIGDMLTRIRNGIRNRRKTVRVPKSKIKIGIAEVLAKEGFIEGYQLVEEGIQGAIEIKLKYGPDGEQLINRIERNSKPGRRVYGRIGDLKPVLNGLGISVLSTSRGILSDREARRQKVGGEVLCTVW
jgi:small subunit ribosomal protein S8